jgi:hypothetical protein
MLYLTDEGIKMSKKGKSIVRKGIKKLNKFNPTKYNITSVLAFIVAFAALGGIITVLVSNAAATLVVDATVPQPQNVRVFPDNQSVIVTWNDTQPPGVVGYYLTYKKRGASAVEGVKQTIHNSMQLQPLENGQEYEITVQSARGSYQTTATGSIAENDNSTTMFWARADGRVSPAVTVLGTPSSARVDAMRNRLTGFFDEFNEPANPFDELKWNNAAFCDHGDSASAFINNQFHSHNSISCGFGGTVSRPRATFNTTVGLNGGPISESNPAQVEFDMDATVDGRSKWYLDFVPLSARNDRYPIDVDGHHTADDSQDREEPGNMLRLETDGGGYGAQFTYWDTNRNFQRILSNESPSFCGPAWNPDQVDFRTCGALTNKTLVPASPLPEQDLRLLFSAQNVRRHWVMQFTPTKVKVFVDGTQIMQATLPPNWAAERQYTLQNTLFSYNTAKQFVTSSSNMARRGVIPKFNFYHWDNFGFTGPAPTTVTHNYIDGGADGNTPNYLNNIGSGTQGNRTTIIPVPDEIGTPLNNRGRLYFSLKSRNDSSYNWRLGDHIIFNGRRYEVPDPRSTMPSSPDYNAVGGLNRSIISMALNINLADIRRGSNTVTFNLTGTGANGIATNVHLELEYAKSGTVPSYTQPIDIYGQSLSNIVETRMTNCDSYIYVEQDIDLPFLAGRANMAPAPCYYLSTMPNHTGHDGTPNPVPTPDTQPPVVQLTAPANNATVSNNTITATATATDNVSVSAVEFYVGGILRATDTSSPYSAALDFSSLASGSYSIYAIARDTSNNASQTSAVTVVKPAAADTTAPTVSITAPTNGTTVATGATTLNVTASASDAVGVTRVDFYLNNSLYAQDPSSPYSTSISLGSLQSGTHSLFARAYDLAGNTRQSTTVSFTIPVPAPTTCPIGQTGTPPNCTTPPPETCPEGQTGTPPNCTVPPPPPPPTTTKVGDINGDGNVNIFDLSLLLSRYNQTVTVNTNGDLNGDSRVTIIDLSILLSNYGK